MKSSDVCIKTTYNRCLVMNEKELEALLEEATKTDKNLARLFNGKMTVSRNPAEKRIKADTPLYDDLADTRYIESLSDCIQKRIHGSRFVKWYRLLVNSDKKV